MTNLKRSISFLLALVMMFTMVPLNAFAATEETTEVVTNVGQVEQVAETTPPEAEEILPQAEGTGEIPVTRAQWLQLLVQTFDYSIEGEIVPDNYFPDLSPEAEYYEDILIAVYYGLVDVLPNENINPEGAATREFAAYTLNACMGYLPQEEEYGFSEAATVTYPDDIRMKILISSGALWQGGMGDTFPAQVVHNYGAHASLCGVIVKQMVRKGNVPRIDSLLYSMIIYIITKCDRENL